jgi:DNA-binding MarR family transcriptional regulator
VSERGNRGDPSGLDYLYKTRKIGSQQDPSQSSAPSATSNADASIRAYPFMRVLDSIRKATETTDRVRLSEVGKDVEMTAETLVPLSQRLVETGLVQVVEPIWGDDAVALTDRGRDVLERGRDQELAQLLGLG